MKSLVLLIISTLLVTSMSSVYLCLMPTTYMSGITVTSTSGTVTSFPNNITQNLMSLTWNQTVNQTNTLTFSGWPTNQNYTYTVVISGPGYTAVANNQIADNIIVVP